MSCLENDAYGNYCFSINSTFCFTKFITEADLEGIFTGDYFDYF